MDRGGDWTEAASGQRQRVDIGGEWTEAYVWDIFSACLDYLIKKTALFLSYSLQTTLLYLPTKNQRNIVQPAG